MKIKRIVIPIIFLSVLIVCFFGGYTIYTNSNNMSLFSGLFHEYKEDNQENNKKTNSSASNNSEKTKEKLQQQKKASRKPADITFTSLGNIMFHGNQIKAASTSKGYDFNPSFPYIKDLVSSSDLSMAVFEGSFVNNNYQGYPLFRTPDSVATAIEDCGVDILNEASNHVFDGGESGMKRSRDIATKAGMNVIGVKGDNSSDNFLVKDVKGYKIGITSYTYETPPIKGNKAVNGIPLTNKGVEYINTFNYDDLDSFYNKLKNQIVEMKKQGADFIMVALHWGDEYSTKANSYQKTISSKLNELGVDVILGGHPHVPQPYETITGNGGHKTFVIYGQGNTLSNQSSVLLNEPRVEDGYIVNLVLHGDGTKVELKDYSIVPIFLYREVKTTGLYYNRIVPAKEAINNRKKFKLTDSAFNQAKQSLNRTLSVVGNHKIK